MKITKEQVIPMLLEVCPSFQPLWEEHLRDHKEELVYVALGDFAHHLLALYQQNHTECFPAVANVIERLHVEGDHSVKEIATIGALEGIQNVWANSGVDPDLFKPWLLPESRRYWDELNKFWLNVEQHRLRQQDSDT